MSEAAVIALASVVISGLSTALVLVARSLGRAMRDNNELVRTMSNQVVVYSDHQLDRIKIEAGAEVAKDYTSKIASRAVEVPTAGGTYQPDDADFVTRPS